MYQGRRTLVLWYHGGTGPYTADTNTTGQRVRQPRRRWVPCFSSRLGSTQLRVALAVGLRTSSCNV